MDANNSLVILNTKSYIRIAHLSLRQTNALFRTHSRRCGPCANRRGEEDPDGDTEQQQPQHPRRCRDADADGHIVSAMTANGGRRSARGSPFYSRLSEGL